MRCKVESLPARSRPKRRRPATGRVEVSPVCDGLRKSLRGNVRARCSRPAAGHRRPGAQASRLIPFPFDSGPALNAPNPPPSRAHAKAKKHAPRQMHQKNPCQCRFLKPISTPLDRLGVDSSTVEQRPFKSLVQGSNPCQPTMRHPKSGDSRGSGGVRPRRTAPAPLDPSTGKPARKGKPSPHFAPLAARRAVHRRPDKSPIRFATAPFRVSFFLFAPVGICSTMQIRRNEQMTLLKVIKKDHPAGRARMRPAKLKN